MFFYGYTLVAPGPRRILLFKIIGWVYSELSVLVHIAKSVHDTHARAFDLEGGSRNDKISQGPLVPPIHRALGFSA